MERTLVLLKPDALQRGLVGEIISRFEKAGLKIVSLKMVQPDEKHYRQHYDDIGTVTARHGEEIYRLNTDFMMTGPVVALAVEGIEAVAAVRKIVGSTEPGSAAPGTIRGDYAHMTYNHVNKTGSGLPNLVHASANQEEASKEVKLWFSDQELFDYKAVHEHLTQSKKS